eukprot:9839371-Ditylum_brightwellii.AAC.1
MEHKLNQQYSQDGNTSLSLNSSSPIHSGPGNLGHHGILNTFGQQSSLQQYVAEVANYTLCLENGTTQQTYANTDMIQIQDDATTTNLTNGTVIYLSLNNATSSQWKERVNK